MKLLGAARSAPARYALVFSAVCAVASAGGFALTYSWITSLLQRHLEEAVEMHLAVLRDTLTLDGREALVRLVRKHDERPGASTIHVLVKDEADNILAGDLPPLASRTGWQDIELPVDANDRDVGGLRLRGNGARFDDGTFLLVTNDTGDLRDTQALLIRSFGLSLAVVVVLSLAGGLAIGNPHRTRSDDTNRTARAIMDGDLARRIPIVQGMDELGGLAEILNRMLARIEELVENLRLVTSSVAHDLRSPLGRHRQRLDTVRLKPRSAREYEAAIDAAIEDTDTILKIFDGMLRLAQIEAGTPRERFMRVDLSPACENVADAFAAVAEDDGKQLLANIARDVNLRGNRELLMQLLANLVENALRHTPTGTTVRMELETRFGRPRITVDDDGPGIPADEKDRVFRQFYRLDASRSTPGNGLGLAFVLAVVKLHNATISLEDNDPGLRVVVVFAEQSLSASNS